MDMSEFDVILGMDWLTAHQVVIDCDRKRVTAYTLDGICVMFQGDKHDALPRAVYNSRCRIPIPDPARRSNRIGGRGPVLPYIQF